MLQDAPALLVASEFFRTAAGSFCIAVFINIALSVDFPIDLALIKNGTFEITELRKSEDELKEMGQYFLSPEELFCKIEGGSISL